MSLVCQIWQLSHKAKKNNVTLKSYLIKDILHHVHTCDPVCGMGG